MPPSLCCFATEFHIYLTIEEWSEACVLEKLRWLHRGPKWGQKDASSLGGITNLDQEGGRPEVSVLTSVSTEEMLWHISVTLTSATKYNS